MKLLICPLVLTSLAVGALVASVSTAAASPITISAVAGPIALPSVPVVVCVTPGPGCVSTPSATSITVAGTLTVDVGSGLPTITPGLCPAGQIGAVLVVSSGTDSVTLSGSATVTPTSLHAPLVVPIGPIMLVPGATSTVSACSTAKV